MPLSDQMMYYTVNIYTFFKQNKIWLKDFEVIIIMKRNTLPSIAFILVFLVLFSLLISRKMLQSKIYVSEIAITLLNFSSIGVNVSNDQAN